MRTFVAWYRALSSISTQIASQSLVLIPVVALVAAAVLQHEAPTARVVLACVLIIVGVTIAIWHAGGQKKPIPVSAMPRARKSAIGTEHHTEPGDVRYDTSISSNEDRRR